MERRGGGLVRNEGEAECLRVVEAAGTTLTAHKIGRHGRGRAEKIERSEHLEIAACGIRPYTVFLFRTWDRYTQNEIFCLRV
jgi:hypothetical protein